MRLLPASRRLFYVPQLFLDQLFALMNCLGQERKRDRQFVSADSCPKNRPAEPGRVFQDKFISAELIAGEERGNSTDLRKLEDGSYCLL